MGDVATIFKVYTETGKELEVRDKIISDLKPKSIQLEDVAFGIKVIKVMFIHTDEEGSTKFEEKIKSMKNVTEVEVADQTLL
ncbi:MAG: hypothetical protein QXD23_02750 [Candidatus Micrarchaeaceae archaeon]